MFEKNRKKLPGYFFWNKKSSRQLLHITVSPLLYLHTNKNVVYLLSIIARVDKIRCDLYSVKFMRFPEKILVYFLTSNAISNTPVVYKSKYIYI